MSASVGTNTGTPSVTVTKSGTDENPSFALAFDGLKGESAQGIPTGGTTGQVLQKKSNTNYDTEWATPSGGGDTFDFVQFSVTSSSYRTQTEGVGGWTDIFKITDYTQISSQRAKIATAKRFIGVMIKLSGMSVCLFFPCNIAHTVGDESFSVGYSQTGKQTMPAESDFIMTYNETQLLPVDNVTPTGTGATYNYHCRGLFQFYPDLFYRASDHSCRVGYVAKSMYTFKPTTDFLSGGATITLFFLK